MSCDPLAPYLRCDHVAWPSFLQMAVPLFFLAIILLVLLAVRVHTCCTKRYNVSLRLRFKTLFTAKVRLFAIICW